MKKKIRYFIPLLVLLVITIICTIISISLFSAAMKAMKDNIGTILAGIIIIAFFAISLIASLVCSLVLLSISIKSYKISENKTFPLICVIASSIIALLSLAIIIAAIILK